MGNTSLKIFAININRNNMRYLTSFLAIFQTIESKDGICVTYHTIRLI